MRYKPTKRRGRVRRRSLPRAALKLGFLAAALVGLYYAAGLGWRAGSVVVTGWLEKSSWAQLKSIEVVGLERLPEQDVIRAAAVPEGANLMRLPLDSVAARVETLPAVRRAWPSRRLPGRLVIKVGERVPVAALFGRKLMLTDAEGVIFKQAFVGEMIDLPIMTGNVEPGGEGFRQALDFILELRRDYPVVYEHLGEVHCDGEGMTLRLREGGAAVNVADIRSESALASLDRFLMERCGDLNMDVRYVDLRFLPMIITGTGEGRN